jgi:CHASE2 domain-containing sensor protein
VALARRPRLPAATRQSSVILHQSAVAVFRGGCCFQWLAFAQGQWFPGRPPFLRSGGWGVALWRAAAGLLPSRALVSPAAGG